MQTARLRQTTLDRIRAKSAEATPLRPHWTDRPDAPRIQYSAIWWGSESPLAVCAVTVMDDADPRREYYPSAFRKLAERFQERLLTTPPKRAPRSPTIYLRRETFLAIPTTDGILYPIERTAETVQVHIREGIKAYAVVIVDGRERIPKFVRDTARSWPGLSPVYYRLAKYPKARVKNVARLLVGVGRFADAIWLLGGFPA